jgi:deoxycytidine triphosphate deaminase
MILSDVEIKEEIANGAIIVSGWDGELSIGPNSMDLHLDNKALILPAASAFNRRHAIIIELSVLMKTCQSCTQSTTTGRIL